MNVYPERTRMNIHSAISDVYDMFARMFWDVSAPCGCISIISRLHRYWCPCARVVAGHTEWCLYSTWHTTCVYSEVCVLVGLYTSWRKARPLRMHCTRIELYRCHHDWHHVRRVGYVFVCFTRCYVHCVLACKQCYAHKITRFLCLAKKITRSSGFIRCELNKYLFAKNARKSLPQCCELWFTRIYFLLTLIRSHICPVDLNSKSII